MSSKRTKKRVIKAFQLEGLTLSKGALNGVLSVLKSEEDEAGAIRVMIKSLKARIDRDETRSYVFFKMFTLTQIFNTLNIQPTYM